MRIAHLDTIGGIAGDMILAAFIGAGMSVDDLTSALNHLGLGPVELIARRVKRSAIDAVQLDVRTTQNSRVHRNLEGILNLIRGSGLSTGVRETAEAVFRVIAEAEARVHGTTADRVHFHEVGAEDSIVDIVGTAICLERFGIGRIYSSPVRLGSGGIIQTQHGPMPTPAPATLEILKDYPVTLTSVPRELTTPTGAAIIKALSAGVLDMETVSVTDIGYGAGAHEFPELPNLLRIAIGELASAFDRDDVVIIETNIDDMNPQMYPVLIDEILAAGAHDAFLTPITMKKGRPGMLVSVMANAATYQTIAELIYRETSTIGLRIHHSGRLKLPRRSVKVSTSFGPVNAKIVLRDGREITAPEFEECRRVAREHNLPLLEVMRRIERELSSQ
ncbi:MAG: nickel pincer cofactor biosynthesis protein LarC [Bacteroidota bacterium]